MENKEVRDVLDIISQNEGMLKAAQKRASIASEVVMGKTEIDTLFKD